MMPGAGAPGMPPGGAPGGMPGGAPPGPPGGTGAVTMPGAMPGGQAQGMSAVMIGMQALQKALPLLPMGSPIHTATLKALTDIGKHMDNPAGGGGDSGQNVQQLIQMMREAQQQPQKVASMQAMMPQGGLPQPQGGAPPGGPQ